MDKFVIDKKNVESVFDGKFIRVFDLKYEEGRHYFDATRRSLDNLVATKTDEEFSNMKPDAVSCFVVLRALNEEPRLLLHYEYRYPAGRYLLSIPAGLMDEADTDISETAKREIFEETGIKVKGNDEIKVIAPFVFATPGMTDEGNALVYVDILCDENTILTNEGAESSEKFGNFLTVTQQEARRILANGRDDNGIFLPLFTWAALMYFVYEVK